MTSSYDRWVELADRDAVGDELTPAERAFLEEFAATDPRARAELALFESLAPMQIASDEPSDEALADAAVRAVLSQRARAPRGGRWLLWGAGSAAAVAAAAVLFVRGAHEHAAAPLAVSVMEYVAGAAAVDGQQAIGGARVPSGAVVSAAGGPVCVAVEPRIHACLAAGSALRLSHVAESRRRLDLLSGRVAVALDPLPAGQRLSVVANGVWSTAVGTAFTVELLADGSVRTVVHEGKVAVGGEQSTDHVSGHKIGLAHGVDVRIEPPAPHATTETPEWAALGKVATRSIEGPTAAVEPPLSPAVSAVQPEQQDSEARPGATANAASTARVRPAEVTPFPGTPESLLGAARQSLRDQRWDDAASAYRRLVRSFPSSPEAHTVLVPLAQLEVDRLGQPAAALEDVNAYLARGGSLALEARLVKVRAFRALGRPSDEAAAIEEVLAAHPSSLDAGELRERLSALRASGQRAP